jgi:hypothetical protein
MKDKTDEEILNERSIIEDKVKFILNNQYQNTEISFIKSILDKKEIEEELSDETGAIPTSSFSIYCLSESIKHLSKADIVVFSPNFYQGRGTMIEFEIASKYGKKILVLNDLKIRS